MMSRLKIETDATVMESTATTKVDFTSRFLHLSSGKSEDRQNAHQIIPVSKSGERLKLVSSATASFSSAPCCVTRKIRVSGLCSMKRKADAIVNNIPTVNGTIRKIVGEILMPNLRTTSEDESSQLTTQAPAAKLATHSE